VGPTRRIRVREPQVDPWRLPAELHPVLRRIYTARAIGDPAELQSGLDGLLPLTHLNGLHAAVELLRTALREGQCILIYGDYDVDGATSAAVAVLALRAMGAARVDFLVPDRFRDGYGLTAAGADRAADRGAELLITVDNGIASHGGVARAHARGLKVLITDHHLPGPTLPPADAILNPNLPDEGFPSKHLAGVGVVFYALMGLRAALREATDADRLPKLGDYLDLVALGTVADVVTLDRNNRILVEQGLRRIRAGVCRPGIQALLEIAGRRRDTLTAQDLGFAVAPRLNAAGRLEDMSIGIQCLLADDPATARNYAETLDQINRDRRAREQEMQTQASFDPVVTSAEREPATALCLFDERWHEGIVGLLASRLKDRHHRPTIAFAPAVDGRLKGSARSIPGLHIRDTLAWIHTQEPDLIDTFGGHAMAAGLTLPRPHFERFSERFVAAVGARVQPEDLEAVLWSDGELPAEQITVELAQVLAAAGPWGEGFPAPRFHGPFEVIKRRGVSDNQHTQLVLRPQDGQRVVDGIAFRQPPNTLPTSSDWRIVYQLALNEWQGERSPKLIVDYAEAIDRL